MSECAAFGIDVDARRSGIVIVAISTTCGDRRNEHRRKKRRPARPDMGCAFTGPNKSTVPSGRNRIVWQRCPKGCFEGSKQELLSMAFAMPNSFAYHNSMIGRSTRWLAMAAAGMAIGSFTAAAAANGRYPRGQYLKEAAGDPNSLVLSATYGLLVTADRGKNWYLVCERGLFGRLPGQLDVIETWLEQTASGVLLAASDKALRVSRDRGCSFTTETALPVDWNWFDSTRTKDKGHVADLTSEKAKGEKAVLALVADVNGPQTGFQIYETLDDADTWKPLGNPIPPTTLGSGITLDVAPSDANRIYVSGRGKQGPMVVVASTDGGQTWSSAEVPDTADSYGTYIAAVSPSDPNVLYVRTDIWLPEQEEFGEDRLHHSNDGGKTWTEILRKRAKLMGFALSPDGKTVLAGYGDPAEASGRQVEDADVGIYRADAGSANFTKIYDGSISCLTWNATGLYVCTKQDRDGFHLGFAPNASFDLGNKDALQRLLTLPNVRGPLPRAAGSGESVCKGDWIGMPPDMPGACGIFGACGDGGIPTSGPALCGTTGGGAGSGGASGAGGGGGTPGPDGGGRGGAGSDGTVVGDKESSCSCSLPSTGQGKAYGAWGLILAAIGAAIRAGRRRPPD